MMLAMALCALSSASGVAFGYNYDVLPYAADSARNVVGTVRVPEIGGLQAEDAIGDFLFAPSAVAGEAEVRVRRSTGSRPLRPTS